MELCEDRVVLEPLQAKRRHSSANMVLERAKNPSFNMLEGLRGVREADGQSEAGWVICTQLRLLPVGMIAR